MARTLKQQIMNRCVHFTGVQNGECEAGIKYEDFHGKGLPCFKDSKAANECEKRRWILDDEAEREVLAIKEHSARTFIGIAAVCEDAENQGFGKGNGGEGAIACPVCEHGTILYSVSGYNGHRHARCSTDNCVCFME